MEADAPRVSVSDGECQSVGYLWQEACNVSPELRWSAVSEFAFEEGVYCCLPAFRADTEVVSVVWQRLVAPFTFLDWALSEFLEFLYEESCSAVVHQTAVIPLYGLHLFSRHLV